MRSEPVDRRRRTVERQRWERPDRSLGHRLEGFGIRPLGDGVALVFVKYDPVDATAASFERLDRERRVVERPQSRPSDDNSRDSQVREQVDDLRVSRERDTQSSDPFTTPTSADSSSRSRSHLPRSKPRSVIPAEVAWRPLVLSVHPGGRRHARQLVDSRRAARRGTHCCRLLSVLGVWSVPRPQVRCGR